MADELKPRRSWKSNKVFRLLGGNEDNDLWVHADGETIASIWEPTDEQRQAIAEGANIELWIWGQGMPPVSLTVNSRTPLGKPPEGAPDG